MDNYVSLYCWVHSYLLSHWLSDRWGRYTSSPKSWPSDALSFDLPCRCPALGLSLPSFAVISRNRPGPLRETKSRIPPFWGEKVYKSCWIKDTRNNPIVQYRKWGWKLSFWGLWFGLEYASMYDTVPDFRKKLSENCLWLPPRLPHDPGVNHYRMKCAKKVGAFLTLSWLSKIEPTLLRIPDRPNAARHRKTFSVVNMILWWPAMNNFLLLTWTDISGRFLGFAYYLWQQSKIFSPHSLVFLLSFSVLALSVPELVERIIPQFILRSIPHL